VDFKAAYEEAQETIRQLKARIEKLEGQPASRGSAQASAKTTTSTHSQAEEEVAMSLDAKRPVIDVTKRRYVLEANDEELIGRLALLLTEGFFDSPKKTEHINEEFRARGWSAQTGRPSPKNLEMAKLAEYGFIRIVGMGSYQAVPGMKVNVKEVAAA